MWKAGPLSTTNAPAPQTRMALSAVSPTMVLPLNVTFRLFLKARCKPGAMIAAQSFVSGNNRPACASAIFSGSIRKPPFLVRGLFGVGQCLDGVLPGAGGDAIVCAGQICLGDLQIERGLPERLIFGKDDLLGRISVLGLQTERLVFAAKRGAFSHARIARLRTGPHR